LTPGKSSLVLGKSRRKTVQPRESFSKIAFSTQVQSGPGFVKAAAVAISLNKDISFEIHHLHVRPGMTFMDEFHSLVIVPAHLRQPEPTADYPINPRPFNLSPFRSRLREFRSPCLNAERRDSQESGEGASDEVSFVRHCQSNEQTARHSVRPGCSGVGMLAECARLSQPSVGSFPVTQSCRWNTFLAFFTER
jgi:hypothetical protein